MMNKADGTGITSGLTEIANQMEELNTEIDTAENPLEVMNALRGKQGSVEEYRTELAEMVGSKDAEKTPESVLTLIQPLMTAMEATQQSVPQSGIAETSFSESRTPEEIYSDYYKQFNYTPKELALSQQYAPQGGITNALTPKEIANNPVASGMMSDEWRQQNIPQGFKNGGIVHRFNGSPPGGEQAGSAGFFTESDIPVAPTSSSNPMEMVKLFRNLIPEPKTYQEYFDAYSKASPQQKGSAYDALGYQSLINLGSTIASAPKGQLASTVLDPQNMQRISDPLLKMVMGKAQEEKARKASIAKSATEAKLKADEAYQKGQSGVLTSALPKIIDNLKPDQQIYGNEKIGYYVYDKKTKIKTMLEPGLGNASEKERAFEKYVTLQEQLKNAEFGTENYKTIKQQIGLISDIINPKGQFESVLSKSVQQYSDELSKKKPDLSADAKQRLVNKYEKKIIDQWLLSETTDQKMYDENLALNKNMAEELSKLREEINKDVSLSNELKSLAGQALLGGEVFQTGSLAETRLNFGKLLQLIPGGQEAFNTWAQSKGVDTTALNTILDSNTDLDLQVGAGELVKRAGASFAVYMADNFPGNLNQSEVDLIKNAGPQLTTSLQGLKVLSHIYTKSAERANNISTFYNDYFRTKEGEKISFGGQEITVSKDPLVMVADLDEGIKNYIISTDMFDEKNKPRDNVLIELISGLPSEADTNAQLGAMNFVTVPPSIDALIPLDASNSIKLKPEDYGIMTELKKLKPQLQDFITQYNNSTSGTQSPITIDLDNPASVTKNNISQLNTLVNHIQLNLKTPELDKFLGDYQLQPGLFALTFFAEVNQ
tara:strand:+ start:1713 stop:4205 length:2493 start_codon:yes stop_codon:yes gene_type:complete